MYDGLDNATVDVVHPCAGTDCHGDLHDDRQEEAVPCVDEPALQGAVEQIDCWWNK